jgi:hypothetical protein
METSPSLKQGWQSWPQHLNRFQYVLTPKHGAWLNIVETLFGKMARSSLRHMGVQSPDELNALTQD